MRFATAIIDPPWPYRVPRETADGSASGQSGYSGQVYQPMSVADLCALPVGELVSDLVLLWTTGPMIPSAVKLIDAWGFEWVTMAYWMKTGKSPARPLGSDEKEIVFRPHWGVGYWFRGDVEPFVVAKRKGTPSYRTKERAAFIAPVQAHSSKPPFLHELAEKHFKGPYVEVFARTSRDGWTGLGDGVDERDIRQTMREMIDDGCD